MNDILDELIGYLQTGFSTAITKYYKGYVKLPPKKYLPCIQVYGISTDQSHHSTAKDKAVYTIGIRVVEDVTTKLSSSGTGDIIKAQESIIDLMEERASGGVPNSDSIFGVLTRNIKGTDYLFNDEYRANYENIEKEGFFYTVADMQVVITDLVLRQ